MPSAVMRHRPLGRKFYRRDPVALAQALLGRLLVRVLNDGQVLSGRIVEVEAYLGVADQAAQTFNERHTERNHSMYLDAGHAYVYFTYGMHHCVNIVSDRLDVPTACLIRAIEPVEGIEAMRHHRARKKSARVLRDTDLCSGPAKLTQALAIDRELDGADLVRSDVLFVAGRHSVSQEAVVAAPRVGVAYAGAWAHKPLRFYEKGNPHVSVR